MGGASKEGVAPSGVGVASPAGGPGEDREEEKMDVETTQPEDKVHSKRAEPSDNEEVRSKRTATANSGAHTPKEPAAAERAAKTRSGEEDGKKKEEESDSDSDSDGETPQYLARLLSELITGVADPSGPHRPKEGEEGGGAKDVKSADLASAAEEGEKKKEQEGGRQRTFAERYAGPEGTTVTISAAPAPPFGIAGLPPMEGPSLSIKNRGDGVEPEVRGKPPRLRGKTLNMTSPFVSVFFFFFFFLDDDQLSDATSNPAAAVPAGACGGETSAAQGGWGDQQ